MDGKIPGAGDVQRVTEGAEIAVSDLGDVFGHMGWVSVCGSDDGA